MSGYLLCLAAFLSCLICSISNWRFGLGLLIVWGYFYGILKAHYVASFGHFIFDCATAGFYCGILINFPKKEDRIKWKEILPWTVALVVWPAFVALIPMQHYLVQLVGLRGNVFWLPMLLIGSILGIEGRRSISFVFAILNVIALVVALAEYFLGVEMFVPDNDVTQIVFNSNDIGGGHKRIPSTFTNAHSYAGAMVATIPWLVGGLVDRQKSSITGSVGFIILVAGLISGLLGVFLAGPRSPIVNLGLLFSLAVISGRVNFGLLLVLVLAGTTVGYFVAQNERMQRFTELQDLDMVRERMAMSLNMNFFEVLQDYPMGNGMGAGGTSLPFFAQQFLNQPVIIENEYARILLEQGLPGLLIFLAFLGWFFTRKITKADKDLVCKNLLWISSAITVSTAWIGIGMMSGVPSTAMFLLGIGYSLSCMNIATSPKGLVPRSDWLQPSAFIPAYQKGLART